MYIPESEFKELLITAFKTGIKTAVKYDSEGFDMKCDHNVKIVSELYLNQIEESIEDLKQIKR